MARNNELKALRAQVRRATETDGVDSAKPVDQLRQQVQQLEAELSESLDDVALLGGVNADLQSELKVTKDRATHYRERAKTASRARDRADKRWSDQLNDFEKKFNQMLARKKMDAHGLVTELSTLIEDTAISRGRSQAETHQIQLTLLQVQTELSRRDVEVAAGREPIVCMKNKKEFDDNIVLLTMELITLGVSENIVGNVEALCCRHLAKRELQNVVSKSSARRWGLQLQEVTMHHLGETLSSNAERGIVMGTDTTTVTGRERAANVYQVRQADKSMRTLRGPVVELASHTAAEQMEFNCKYVLSDARRVMDTAGLVDGSERVSMAYFNSVMGDHVNDSLWNLVEVEKFKQLDALIGSQSISPEIAAQLRMFVKTKCSKHKLALISRYGCNAMGDIQDKEVAKFVNMAGHDKSGRTYEAMGPKLVEVVSWQFSSDVSVSNPHGHSNDYSVWADYHGHPEFYMPNTNKNRHFRHEKNACQVLEYKSTMMDFMTDLRDGRDDLVHPNKVTKLGNADSRIYLSLHPKYKSKHKDEPEAQVCAMNMMDSLFYSPMLCMITSPLIDVISIGPQWRAGYDFLTQVLPQKTAEEVMRGGLEHRCCRAFRKKDTTKGQSKSAFDLEFKTPKIWQRIEDGIHPYCEPAFQARVMEYFRAQTVGMAKGLMSIASEYFVGGELYDPSSEIIEALSGCMNNNDSCEQQLGDNRQLITGASGRISSRKVTGLNMARHNNVFEDIRLKRTANTIPFRGKLYNDRLRLEGTDKQMRAKMAARVQPVKDANRKLMMAKVERRHAAHAQLEKVKQFSSIQQVDDVCNRAELKVDEKLGLLKQQLYIYRDLLQYGQKKVPMNCKENVEQANGKMKPTPLTGKKLLQFLADQLKKFITGVTSEFRKFKSWRELKALDEAEDSGRYVEECAESEPDGETQPCSD